MLSTVAGRRRSSKAEKQYCLENCIDYSKFHYWFSRSREGFFGTSWFAPLNGPSVKGVVEVIYFNWVRLKLDVDLGLLSELIHLY